MNFMDKQDLAKFQFKMSFGWISYIAHASWLLVIVGANGMCLEFYDM